MERSNGSASGPGREAAQWGKRNERPLGRRRDSSPTREAKHSNLFFLREKKIKVEHTRCIGPHAAPLDHGTRPTCECTLFSSS